MNSLMSTLRLAPSTLRLQQFRGVSGVVKFFNATKGWGIIATKDDPPKEIFVHQSSIQMDGFRTLEETQEVEFELKQEERGPVAVQVVPKSLPADAPRRKASFGGERREGGGGGFGERRGFRDGGDRRGFRDGGDRPRQRSDGGDRRSGGGYRDRRERDGDN